MFELKEECGVFGLYSQRAADLARLAYYGLFALQHRGQESCGISVNDHGVFTTHTGNGLVNDVFTADILESLGKGNISVGHVRYGTRGTIGLVNAQPVVVNHIKGRMAVAYNGRIVNACELREKFELAGSIFHSSGDAEAIAHVVTSARIRTSSIESAVGEAMDELKGAYSMILMSPAKLVACRDPYGIRPLCIGKTAEGIWVVSSESCGIDAVGGTFVRDVEPGEIVVFDSDGMRSIRTHCGSTKSALCVFEYIYFARPDSVIDGCAVQAARIKAGELLAETYPVEADVVVGVPDSGLDAAVGYSRKSGIAYGVGFIKNKYIGRTFIAPEQATREGKVRIKLNPVSVTVSGKRVVLIDDSIVRGTTSARIVRLLREAGAKEVHMRVTAPPFINACYYGTDISETDALIARDHKLEDIAGIIGADSLGYLKRNQVGIIAEGCKLKGFCTACFDGYYPTEKPERIFVNKYDKKINEGRS
ncbi:MAG: amidophosphoribosyltransferase [Eubacteriales bacterium]|nr:amidophosphoribosyltransferase [Eubacteriales bacterium]